jgi:hypothetical protein
MVIRNSTSRYSPFEEDDDEEENENDEDFPPNSPSIPNNLRLQSIANSTNFQSSGKIIRLKGTSP